jgi:hypothetical protein
VTVNGARAAALLHMMLPPQEHLLLAAIGNASAAELEERGSSLDEDGWYGFGRLALRHGVAPLVHDRLAHLSLQRAARRAIDELAIVHDEIARRNTLLLDRLREILHALRAAHLPLIVLKGGFVVDAVYHDRGLRTMRDLDVLARVSDLEKIETLLLDMGYGPRSRPSIAETCRYHNHLEPFTRADGTRVDVHWTVEYPTAAFVIDPASLWESEHFARIAGETARVLAPHHCLLHLCLHASHHHRFQVALRSIVDLAFVIRHYGALLDWGRLVSVAEKWGVAQVVYASLRVAQELTAAAVPEEVLDALQPTNAAEDIVPHACHVVVRRDFSNSRVVDQWLHTVSSTYDNTSETSSPRTADVPCT